MTGIYFKGIHLRGKATHLVMATKKSPLEKKNEMKKCFSNHSMINIQYELSSLNQM